MPAMSASPLCGSAQENAEPFGELMAELGAGEVAGGDAVREQATGIDGAGLTGGVGGHVRDDDVLVELRFEIAVRVVPVRRGDHPAGLLLHAVAAHMEALTLEVAHPDRHGRLDRFLDGGLVGVGALRVDRGDGLGDREGDVVAQHDLGLLAVPGEPLRLAPRHQPLPVLVTVPSR